MNHLISKYSLVVLPICQSRRNVICSPNQQTSYIVLWLVDTHVIVFHFAHRDCLSISHCFGTAERTTFFAASHSLKLVEWDGCIGSVVSGIHRQILAVPSDLQGFLKVSNGVIKQSVTGGKWSRTFSRLAFGFKLPRNKGVQ